MPNAAAADITRQIDDRADDAPPAAHAQSRTPLSPRAVRVLLALAIALGVGIRLKHYFAQNPYWHDEASIVLNIFDKPAVRLFGALDSAQAAPPGFLLIERGVHVLLGRSELAMRLPPLLAALAGIALFAWLAWRTFVEDDAEPSHASITVRVVLLLVLLWAGSERLIWHAAEAKQYGFDVLVSLALILVALDRTQSATVRLITCAAFATPAVWFSHPTAFVFGGISIALLPAILRERGRRGGFITWFASSTLVGVSFLVLYFISVRNQQVNALYDYWAPGFVPFEQFWTIPIWFVRQLTGIANYACDLAGPVLLPLAMVGGHRLWKLGGDARERLAILTLPAVLLLLASAVRSYPFIGSRVTLFLTPQVYLLAGFGLVSLFEWARRDRPSRHWLAIAVPGYLIALVCWHSAVYLVRPPLYGNMPAAVRYVAAHDAPGDLVFANKVGEFRCYWPSAQVRDARELADTVPDGRFWLVVSYMAGKPDRAVKPLLEEVTPEATQLDAFNVPGGTALLFDGIDGPSTRPASKPVR